MASLIAVLGTCSFVKSGVARTTSIEIPLTSLLKCRTVLELRSATNNAVCAAI